MGSIIFKEQEITIKTSNGIANRSRKVRAFVAGPLAVHTAYGLGRRGFTVTHLPTGRRIFESPTLGKAKTAVRIMLASSTPWDSLRVRDANRKALKAQREEWLIPIVKRGLKVCYSETPEEFLARVCGIQRA
jgi:hypothetical protein